MAEEIERPTIGIVPKLLVAALALFGLITLIAWITSWLFGLARFALLIAVVVLAVLWVSSRFGRDGSDTNGA